MRDLSAILVLLVIAGAGVASAAEYPDCTAFFAEHAPSAPAVAETQRLHLPTDLPSRFDVAILVEGSTHVLQLERHSLRAPGFNARAHLAAGRTIEVELPPPATYRGRVLDRPQWSVVASLGPQGLDARIFAGQGRVWTIRSLLEENRSSGTAMHELVPKYGESPGPLEERFSDPSTPGPVPLGQTGLHVAEIALDVGNPIYVANGSSVPAAIAAAEAMLNDVDFFFARDALISFTLVHVIVRTTPFYPTDPSEDILGPLTTEWVTNQAHVHRDVVHLLTDTGVPSGVAATSAMCSLTDGYGWSSGGSGVMGHEISHNWGTNHCREWTPCNSMCFSCLSLGIKTKDTVVGYRDTLSCLDVTAGHSDPIPPYAQPDYGEMTRDEIVVATPLVFDALANDYDGNLDPLSFDAFDSTSKRGGTVTLSTGTGSGGNDTLIYTGPAGGLAGDDHFRYTVGDGTGQQTLGDIEIRVERSLIGYWKLDGSLGDSSGGGRSASATGGPNFVAGVHGQAMEFDGVDDAVTATGFHRDLPSATLVTWVRRNGNQAPSAGLIVAGMPGSRSSLIFGTANELRYEWGNDPATSGWDSNLVVPDLQWVLAALVVDPEKATVYLHDGTTLHSAENPIPHGEMDFQGSINFGRNPGATTPRLNGSLDDIRIYDYALSASEIATLHDLGGPVLAPEPSTGGRLLRGMDKLSWSPGLDALSHDVYVGADHVSVRDATTASPEFRGNTTSTEAAAIPPLYDGVPCYWRIDEVTSGGTVKGDVWAFAIDPPIAHWPLDEVSGTIAEDVAGEFEGTYLGSPFLDTPPARPDLGRSVYLDGIDDAIELPPLNLQTHDVTIAAWVWRNGDQTEDAGLILTRSQNTVAGLKVTAGGGLRYAWNDTRDNEGGAWWTGAGLSLPNATWALVVMVIEPDGTTVYVGVQSLAGAKKHLDNGREEWDGLAFLGQDPIGGRFFRGRFDDVRIYDHALSFEEVEALFAAGVGAGRVPDGAGVPGTPLLLDTLPGGEVLLDWSPACVGFFPDYAVYEGAIGDFTSHVPATCSTAGQTSTTVTPDPGNRYFLVVPRSANREGGYGTGSDESPRPQSTAACLVQYALDCN